MSNSGGRRPENREPTIKDVAAMAGVSIGTVSNVLNDPGRVTAATQDRVRTAIARSGFIRNSNARALATGRAPTVALIVPDITNTLFVDISKGAQAAARKYGLGLVIANADNDLQQQDNYLDLFAEARSTGILLAPMNSFRGGVERVRAHGRHVVLINYDEEDLEACSVLMDNEGGGRIAATHLIELGYRRLVFVGADDALQPMNDRRLGVRAVASEFSVHLNEIDVFDLHHPGEGHRVGVDLARRWSTSDGPIGVLAVTDSLAEEILHGILSTSCARVPEDIAVMGMDGNRMSWGTPITMSTLHLPGHQIGAEALRLLVDESGPAHTHQRVSFPLAINARQSTMGRATVYAGTEEPRQ